MSGGSAEQALLMAACAQMGQFYDLPTGVAGYRSQGQIAVGGLVGYNFGPVNLQAFVTRDVIDRHYGGRDTRAWLRAVIPLYQDRQEAAPGRTLVTREQSR